MNLSPKLGQPKAMAVSFMGLGAAAYLLKYEMVPLPTFALGMVVLCVSLVPLFDWLRRNEATIPMIPLVCLSYGVYTGGGAIMQPNSIVILSKQEPIEWDYINYALLIALAGIIVLELTYLAALNRLRSLPNGLELRIHPERRYPLIILLIGASLSVNALFIMGKIPWGGHIQITQGFLLIACVLIAGFHYRRQTSGVHAKAILAILLSYLVINGFVSGMLEAALVPLVAVLIVRSAWTRQLPIRFLMIGFVAVTVVNSTKMDYRVRVWNNAEATSYADSMRIWGEVVTNFNIKNFAYGDPAVSPIPLWRQSLARFSLIERIGWVCKNTPDPIPHLKGESYYPFLYALIPRLIWPEKPIISEALTNVDAIYNLAVVNSYGVLTAAVGISYLGEGYANFGWIGVILVMCIQGVVLGAIDAIYNRPGSEGGAAIFVVSTVYMINGVGSAAVNIYGILLQGLIVSTFAILPFTSRFRSRNLQPPPAQRPESNVTPEAARDHAPGLERDLMGGRLLVHPRGDGSKLADGK